MLGEIQFIVELTNRCNFKCKYCYLEQSENISENHIHCMSTITGEKLLDYIYTNFYERYELIYIDFLDGEPLINFDVMRAIVKYGDALAKRPNKFVFRFTTNGSLLTQEIVDFAEKYDIYFNISVDGTQKSHDKNRVFADGTGTSSIVYEKLMLIQKRKNVGIVSTYSSNTYKDIKAGTVNLMNMGFQHIEINFCMGDVEKYDIDNLILEYISAINLFLSRYERGDFTYRYVILDRILQKLFCNEVEKSYCVYPFKITYDGLIKSCDRIPYKYNKVLGSIRDGEFNFFDIKKMHYCSKSMYKGCNMCTYRNFCTPCNVYTDSIYNNQRNHKNEPVFCVVMKCLIDEAKKFYANNKNSLKIAIQFNPSLRQMLISRKTGNC